MTNLHPAPDEEAPPTPSVSWDRSVHALSLVPLAVAADRLALSVSTLRRAIDRGELRASRFGRAIRVSEKDLADYVRGHRIAPSNADVIVQRRRPTHPRSGLRRRLLDADDCS